MLSLLATIATAATVASAGAFAGPQPSAPALHPQHYRLQRLAQRDDIPGEPLVATWRYQELGVNMTIGTPPQHVVLALNQAASYTFLYSKCDGPSPPCNPGLPPPGVPAFNFSDSTSAQITNLTEEQKDLQSTWGDELRIGQDTVSLGGHTIDNFKFYVNNFNRSYSPATGHLGFGLGKGLPGTDNDKSLFSQMSSQWPEPLMGLYVQKRVRRITTTLTGKEIETYFDEGEVTFGGTNDSYYDGDIHWVNSSADAWRIPLDGIKLNGKSLNISNSSSGSTNSTGNGGNVNGTTSIDLNLNENLMAKLHPDIVGAIETELGLKPSSPTSSVAIQVPCDGTYNFTFTIAGKDYKLSGDDTLQYVKNGTETWQCLLAVSRTEEKMSLGSAFFGSVYSVFRFDSPQVGFATLKEGLPVLDTRDRDLHAPRASAAALRLATPSMAGIVGLGLWLVF